jgi:hypothetical protein
MRIAVMRIAAASCTTVRDVVDGDPQAAVTIGACASAVYFRIEAGQVLALVTRDAIRLPCAVVLARRATELPLTSLVPDGQTQLLIGSGRIEWNGPRGPVAVLATGSWRPPSVPAGRPAAAALAQLDALVQMRDIGISLAGAMSGADPRPAALLGRGPGLTPSGDDVLAGYLIGARAFGVPFDHCASGVELLAARRTTALSAQLLRHAAEGECAPPLADLVAACMSGTGVDDAAAAVLRIGATSGAALLAGLALAARRARVHTEAAA